MQILVNSIPKVISTNPIRITSFEVYNPNTYSVYIKFYDSPSGAVLGSSAPAYTTQVEAQGTLWIEAAGAVYKSFFRGLTLAATQQYSQSDTTAIDLSLIINL